MKEITEINVIEVATNGKIGITLHGGDVRTFAKTQDAEVSFMTNIEGDIWGYRCVTPERILPLRNKVVQERIVEIISTRVILKEKK